MGALQTLENNIAGAFKDLPQLPDSSKEGLAKVWPWLALIGGVLQLFSALVLWRVASFADRLYDGINSLSVYYTGHAVGPSGMDKTIIYIGVAMLVVDGVILLLAFPKLQKRAKAGWDLLFLGAIINLVYGIVQIFTYQRGVGSFIGSLVGSLIAFYLLFQVREKFGGPAVKKSSGPTSPTAIK